MVRLSLTALKSKRFQLFFCRHKIGNKVVEKRIIIFCAPRDLCENHNNERITTMRWEEEVKAKEEKVKIDIDFSRLT